MCWSLIWEAWKTLILTVFKYFTLFSGDFMPLKFKEITLKSLCMCINISNESALMSNPHMYIYIILICVTNWTRSPLSTIWYLKMVFSVCLDIYPEAFEALNNKTLAYTGWCPHHFPTCNQQKRKKIKCMNTHLPTNSIKTAPPFLWFDFLPDAEMMRIFTPFWAVWLNMT